MTKFVKKLKKPLLLTILNPLRPFSEKNGFSQNMRLLVLRFYNYLRPYKKITQFHKPSRPVAWSRFSPRLEKLYNIKITDRVKFQCCLKIAIT